MEGKSTWVGIAVVVIVVAGLAWSGLKPETFPNATVVSEGESVTIDQVRGDRSKLVLALLHPSDPNSATAVDKLKAEYATYETRATFAGIVFGTPAEAAAFQKAHELPFAVYALTPQANQAEYNDVVKKVGGFRDRFFVGTVVVLEPSRRISQQVNGNELEKLSSTLSKL